MNSQNTEFYGLYHNLLTNNQHETAQTIMHILDKEYNAARTLGLARAAMEPEPVTPYLPLIIQRACDFIAYLKGNHPSWVVSDLQRNAYKKERQFHFKVVNSDFLRNWINLYVEYSPIHEYRYGIEVFSFRNLETPRFSTRHAISDLNRVQQVMFIYLTKSAEDPCISIGESEEDQTTSMHRLSLEESDQRARRPRTTPTETNFRKMFFPN